ncbi:hypothetical protein, partial [Bacteroides xylanisolvens]
FIFIPRKDMRAKNGQQYRIAETLTFTLFTLLRKEALVQTKTQVFSYVEERKKNMTGYRIETADIVSVD